MKNKKKLFLLLSTSFISVMSLSFVISGYSEKLSIKATDKPTLMSCDYYFNEENGYTSIYDLQVEGWSKVSEGNNNTLISGVKTWGTISNIYTNSSSNTCLYIQSTDKYGNNSGINVYNADSSNTYKVGQVVTVNGDYAIYNGTPQIGNGNSITIDYQSNPYPVEIRNIDISFWDDSPTLYPSNRYSGTVISSISGITLSNPSSNRQCIGTDKSGNELTVFFGSLQNASDIYTEISAYCETSNKYTLTGFPVFFKNKNKGTFTREFLINDVSQIEQEDASVTSLMVTESTYYQNLGEELIKPTKVMAIYSDGSNKDVTSLVSYSDYDLNTLGEQTVTVSYGGVITYFDICVIEPTYNKFQIDTSTSLGIGTYKTGNYGFNKTLGVEWYRAIKDDTGYGSFAFALIPNLGSPIVDTFIPGAFCNYNPLSDIKNVTISYYTSTSSGSNSPKLYFGENHLDDNSVDIEYSEYTTTKTINLSAYDVNYFKLEGGDTKFYVTSLIVEYSGQTTPHGSTLEDYTPYSSEYRAATVNYSGSLVAGSSYIDVPTSVNVNINNGTYTVSEYHRYTYYNYDYLDSKRDDNNFDELVSDATITDAFDVAAYYCAFGQIPANFYIKSSYVTDAYNCGVNLIGVSTNLTDITDMFGDNARTASFYNKTDGYAQSVGCIDGSRGYFEFDVALSETYSVKSREVGRIVGWVGGGINSAAYDYGAYRIAHYTDDHYATMQEYNGLGGFMSRFRGDNKTCKVSPVNAVWSTPNFLTQI